MLYVTVKVFVWWANNLNTALLQSIECVVKIYKYVAVPSYANIGGDTLNFRV